MCFGFDPNSVFDRVRTRRAEDRPRRHGTSINPSFPTETHRTRNSGSGPGEDFVRTASAGAGPTG